MTNLGAVRKLIPRKRFRVESDPDPDEHVTVKKARGSADSDSMNRLLSVITEEILSLKLQAVQLVGDYAEISHGLSASPITVSRGACRACQRNYSPLCSGMRSRDI